MASWKKIIVSGSNAELNQVTASFSGDGSGISGITAESIAYSNITGKPTLLSGSAQISSHISGAFATTSSSLATRITNLKSDSGSFSTRATTLEGRVGQSLNTSDTPRFAGLNVDGNIQANQYIVSSSVTYMTSSFMSGSTIFGDDITDTHQITGSTFISGALTIKDTLDAPSVSDTFAAAVVSQIDNDEIPIAKLASDAITIGGAGSTLLGGSATVANILKGSSAVSSSAQLSTSISGSFSKVHLSSKVPNIISSSAEGDAQGQIKFNNVNVDVNGMQTADSPQFTNLTLTGNLTVRGTSSVIATTNLEVKDAFGFFATGSAASNVDAGIIVQSGSAVDSGSAIFHDISKERWSVAKGVGSTDVNIPDSKWGGFVATVYTGSDSPVGSSPKYGVGELHIDEDGEIYIYS